MVPSSAAMFAPTRPARQPRQDRPQLQQHRLADEDSDEVKRDGAREGVRSLESEDDAGKGRNEERDRQRVDTEPRHVHRCTASRRDHVGNSRTERPLAAAN
jgi:hypothetical protein